MIHDAFWLRTFRALLQELSAENSETLNERETYVEGHDSVWWEKSRSASSDSGRLRQRVI
jgi:hypothetical protein